MVEVKDPLPMYEGVAFTSRSPVSVIYTVDENSTIPSDGKSHKVSVVQLPFEAKIQHVTVPSQELLVYLQARSFRSKHINYNADVIHSAK